MPRSENHEAMGSEDFSMDLVVVEDQGDVVVEVPEMVAVPMIIRKNDLPSPNLNIW